MSQKEQHLSCRVSAADYQRAEALARAAGMKLAQWVKQAVMRAIEGGDAHCLDAKSAEVNSVIISDVPEHPSNLAAAESSNASSGPRNIDPSMFNVQNRDGIHPYARDCECSGCAFIRSGTAALKIQFADARLSWSTEWDKMLDMDPQAALQYFDKLARGRQLPNGFKSWGKRERIVWLENHWPLEER